MPDSSRKAAPPLASSVAPFWHTAALVGLISAVALTGTLLRGAAAKSAISPAAGAPGSARFSQYGALLLVNAGLVLYVSRCFRPRNQLPHLLGRGWDSGTRAGIDLALALGAALLIQSLEWLATHFAGLGQNAAASLLLPSTLAERLTWVSVALLVGFSEEVVYRGYLQTQLSAYSGRSSVGILLQAVLFGLAHLEQGAEAALRIALYGLLLGVLARFRRSLLPGIVCHSAIDAASALLH